jgi:hypothetical protein
MLGKKNLVLQDFKVLRNLGARAKHWGMSELTFPRGVERVPERVVGLGFAAGNCTLELVIDIVCYAVNGKDKMHTLLEYRSKTVNGPSLQRWYRYQVAGGQSIIE